MVSVSVKDTGIGISAEHLEAIFEKFYQVEGSLQRSVGGTGLGLAITKGLVETMNGKIWVESEIGSGKHLHLYPSRFERGEERTPISSTSLTESFSMPSRTHTPLTLFFMEVSDQRAEMIR